MSRTVGGTAGDEPTIRESRRTVLVPAAVLLLGWVFLELSVMIFAEGTIHTDRDLLGMAVAAVCAAVSLRWLRIAAWGAVIGAGIHIFAGGPSFFSWVLPIVFTALVAVFENKRLSRLYVAVACGVWVPLSIADYQLWEHGLVYVTTVAAPILIAYGIGRAYRQWRTKQAQAEREVVQSVRARRVALQEQRRGIARDLHDIVAHDLTVISMHAQAVDEKRADPSVAAALEAIRASSAHALQDLRRLLDVLGDEGLVQKEPSEAPSVQLDEALERCPSMLRDLGFTVDVVTSGELSSLPQSLQSCLYRVLHECTTNVIKHGASTHDARQADCTIRLDVASDDVTLVVANWEGSGAAGIHTGGVGLPSLRERVESFGGTFSAGILPDGRWETKAARLPTLKYEA